MKIILIGSGRMGSLINQLAVQNGDEVVAVFDVNNAKELEKTDKIADVVIDFSSPASLAEVQKYIEKTGTALVSGTTGYSPEQMDIIKSLGNFAPVIHSANYSFGVAVMKRILQQVSNDLITNGFDVELVETHHNQKADAPSGTAKLLIDAIDPHHNLTPVYGRSGLCGKRDKNEIGVHAIRGGTIAGIHTVSFFGEDETIEITHSASSRKIFASGALMAAKKLCSKDKGFYTFDEIMF